jgi:hypothetical protein
MTAQDRLHVLVHDEACPDQARVTQHHGEEPDDAFCARLVGEHDLEASEIDLGLLARCSLEADLEGGDRRRPDVTRGSLHGRVAAGVTVFTQLPPQPYGRETGEGSQPFAQIRQERIGAPLPRRSRAIGRRLQATGDISADGLSIDTELTGNGRHRQALPM